MKFKIGDRVYCPHLSRQVFTLRGCDDRFKKSVNALNESMYPLAVDSYHGHASKVASDLTHFTRDGKLHTEGEVVIHPVYEKGVKDELEKFYLSYFDEPPKLVNFTFQGKEMSMPEGTTVRDVLAKIERENNGT